MGGLKATGSGDVVTSSGIAALDGLLGDGGIRIGAFGLIEESGETDFSGALAKYFCAEGLAQGHAIIVLGVDSSWLSKLPNISSSKSPKTRQDSPKADGASDANDAMKIAWRYKNLSMSAEPQADDSFCHEFDLTNRMVLGPEHVIRCLPIGQDIFQVLLLTAKFIKEQQLRRRPTRVVCPSLFAPHIYPLNSFDPSRGLKFVQQLSRVVADAEQAVGLATLPLTLFSDSMSFQTMMEHLMWPVIKLTPLNKSENSTRTGGDREPQALVSIIRGNSSSGDWAMRMSRRGITMEKWSLPPVGDEPSNVLDF